jgi:HEPN domain-containing protein
MKSLYNDKRYADCLYYGHMVLEMTLKANTVKKTKNQAPRTHNLLWLAELTKLKLSKEELEIIAETSTFNMDARYPDEKQVFYKKCTKAYTDKFYNPIISLYKKLCQSVN